MSASREDLLKKMNLSSNATCYEILDISEQVAHSEPSKLRKAFRARILKFHPDKIVELKLDLTTDEANEITKIIYQAYEEAQKPQSLPNLNLIIPTPKFTPQYTPTALSDLLIADAKGYSDSLSYHYKDFSFQIGGEEKFEKKLTSFYKQIFETLQTCDDFCSLLTGLFCHKGAQQVLFKWIAKNNALKQKIQLSINNSNDLHSLLQALRAPSKILLDLVDHEKVHKIIITYDDVSLVLSRRYAEGFLWQRISSSRLGEIISTFKQFIGLIDKISSETYQTFFTLLGTDKLNALLKDLNNENLKLAQEVIVINYYPNQFFEPLEKIADYDLVLNLRQMILLPKYKNEDTHYQNLFKDAACTNAISCQLDQTLGLVHYQYTEASTANALITWLKSLESLKTFASKNLEVMEQKSEKNCIFTVSMTCLQYETIMGAYSFEEAKKVYDEVKKKKEEVQEYSIKTTLDSLIEDIENKGSWIKHSFFWGEYKSEQPTRIANQIKQVITETQMLPETTLKDWINLEVKVKGLLFDAKEKRTNNRSADTHDFYTAEYNKYFNK